MHCREEKRPKAQNINIWGSSKPEKILTAAQKSCKNTLKYKDLCKEGGREPTQTFPQFSVPSKFRASYDSIWKLPAVKCWAGLLPVKHQLFYSLLRSFKEQTTAIPTSQNPLLITVRSNPPWTGRAGISNVKHWNAD